MINTAALTLKDKKVVDAFLDQKPADGKAIKTDGVVLMTTGFPGGGTELARWQDDKIKESITDSETRLMSVDKVLSGITREQIQLTYKGIQYLIRSEDTPYYIGRDENKCDLKVQADQVSRVHCRINFSRGKFVLVDQSTNGCYVKSVNKDEMYIRREEYPLLGNMALSLGVRMIDGNNEIIEITFNS